MLTPEKSPYFAGLCVATLGSPKKQRFPETLFNEDTRQNHTTVQRYLLQRWARKMFFVPGVLCVYTSSDELLILSASHCAGLVGD